MRFLLRVVIAAFFSSIFINGQFTVNASGASAGEGKIAESIRKYGGGYSGDLEVREGNRTNVLGFHPETSGGWSYDRNSPEGPDGWHHNYPMCNGLKQSPINIIESQTSGSYDAKPIFANWGNLNGEVKHDGHSLAFSVTNGVNYVMDDGFQVWRLKNIHTHVIAEHTFGGAHFPLEIHAVSESFNNNIATSDKLAVIAFSFTETSEAESNPDLEPFILAAEKAVSIGGTAPLVSFNLNALIPKGSTAISLNFPVLGYSVAVHNAENTSGNFLDLWDINSAVGAPYQYQLFQWINGDMLKWVATDKCLDVKGGSSQDGTEVIIWPCGSSNANQKWERVGKLIRWKGTSKCMNINEGATKLTIKTCDTNNKRQEFNLPIWPLTSYYSYSGSLTTPDCAEKVNWSVLTVPTPISRSQFRRLVNAQGFSNNFRPTQPLNGRNVYKTLF